MRKWVLETTSFRILRCRRPGHEDRRPGWVRGGSKRGNRVCRGQIGHSTMLRSRKSQDLEVTSRFMIFSSAVPTSSIYLFFLRRNTILAIQHTILLIPGTYVCRSPVAVVKYRNLQMQRARICVLSWRPRPINTLLCLSWAWSGLSPVLWSMSASTI